MEMATTEIEFTDTVAQGGGGPAPTRYPPGDLIIWIFILAELVLGFALIKGQTVADYFMGLKRVQGPWRWPVTLWLLIPGGLITTAFVLAV